MVIIVEDNSAKATRSIPAKFVKIRAFVKIRDFLIFAEILYHFLARIKIMVPSDI